MSAPAVNAALPPVPAASATPLSISSLSPPPKVTSPTVKAPSPSPPANKPAQQNNHSAAGPISLVTENREAKTPDRGKEPPVAAPLPPSPAPAQATAPPKPTSNGVQEPASAKSPVTVPPEAPAVPAPQPTAVNHAEEPPAVAPAQEPEPAAQTSEALPQVPAAPAEAPSKPAEKPQPVKRKRKPPPEPKESTPDAVEGPEGKKPRRKRVPALQYQAPLPEIATVINRSLKNDNSPKPSDEKLIVFFKNEFLAVRNAEGSFYLCQSLQNIYRSSHKIRIRWLSKDEKESTAEAGIYTRDFYDSAEFECILTSVVLQKQEKDKYKLAADELERVQNILKRALDVEKGVSEKPSVTEEHPDGLDVSLYRDESQLLKKKKVAPKRKSSSPKRKSSSPKKAKRAKKTPAAAIEEKTSKAKTKEKKPVKTKPPAPKPVEKTPEKKPTRAERSAARDRTQAATESLKGSPPNEKARVVAKVLRTAAPKSASKAKSKVATKKNHTTPRKAEKVEKPSRSSEPGKSESKLEKRVRGKTVVAPSPSNSKATSKANPPRKASAPATKRGRK